MGTPVMTVEEVERFLSAGISAGLSSAERATIEKVWLGGCRVRQAYSDKFIRPGGTISGPTMMMLADFALYVARAGGDRPGPLAVTINLNINFLRKPEQRDLIAEAKILKLGKRLAVMEVNMFSDGVDEPVAHVTSTYSIPPELRFSGR